MYCTQCGVKMENDFKFCPSCGHASSANETSGREGSAGADVPNNEQPAAGHAAPVSGSNGAPDALPDFDTAEAMTGVDGLAGANAVSDRELAVYIGSNASSYLLKRNEGMKWSWPPFLLDVYWMLYRKMYAYAFGIIAIFSIVVPATCWMLMKMKEELILMSPFVVFAFYALLKVVLGLNGNSFYLNHASVRIARIKQSQPDYAREYAITKAGGTNLALPLVLLLLPVAAAILLSVVAAGIYATYYHKYATIVSERQEAAGLPGTNVGVQPGTKSTTNNGGQSGNRGQLVEMADSIDGTTIDDQVGYDRLPVFVRAILLDWRNRGIPVPALPRVADNPDLERELWSGFVLEYYRDPANRSHSLNTAMDALRRMILDHPEQFDISAEASGQSALSTTGKSGNANNEQLSKLNARLAEAVGNGDEKLVRSLLTDGADPNTRNEYNETLLASIAYIGKVAIVKALLDAGADPQLADEYGTNALLSAVNGSVNATDSGAGPNKSEDDAYRMTKLLLEAGADPNSRYLAGGRTDGFSALMMAADSFPKAALLLLAKGADPGATDSRGNSVLYHATDSPEVFKALLDRGADPHTVNNEGKTVFDFVEKYRLRDIAGLLGMPLNTDPVFPNHTDVENVLKRMDKGLTKARAKELFGKPSSEDLDQVNGNYWIWTYYFTSREQYVFKPEISDTIDFEGLDSGDMRMQMFIDWNPDIDEAFQCSIYVKGNDGKIYHYNFKPGDREVTGFPF